MPISSRRQLEIIWSSFFMIFEKKKKASDKSNFSDTTREKNMKRS